MMIRGDHKPQSGEMKLFTTLFTLTLAYSALAAPSHGFKKAREILLQNTWFQRKRCTCG